MRIHFYKYHGAGNDFIMVDARNLAEEVFTREIVHHSCDRHFGIGADGLILLLKDQDHDFRMKYFNSDGLEGSMCGNGGRCIVAFANLLGVIEKETIFSGIDGEHRGILKEDGNVSVQMKNVDAIQKLEDGWFLNTGSPHFVQVREHIGALDVYNLGREIRNQARFSPAGTNVNFIELSPEKIRIRTYERGVENETLACGTGNVASAIVAYLVQNTDKTSFTLETLGGELHVSFNPRSDGSFADVWLTGPAEYVFEGDVEI